MPAKKVTPAIRKAVAKRAKQCCEYCHSMATFAMDPFVVDHIYPQAKGGETTLDNLAQACHGCNGSKHDKIEA